MTVALLSASMPWVKLYTEALDDAKLLPLTDSVKWRFTQLILLAGECDQDGWLANNMGPLAVETIAMRIRVPLSTLSSDLSTLQKAGLMLFDRKTGAWQVVNFAKRQGRPQSQKRELWRENKKRQRRVLEDTPGTPSDVHRPSPSGLLVTEEEGEEEKDLEGEEEKEGEGAGAPAPGNPKGMGEAAERFTSGSQPADLPASVRVYEANGGSYQTGNLVDGTSRKDHARQFIAAHVADTPESLKLWGQVVFQYQVQWSSKSYTVMINDYYLRGRIPGQSNGQSSTMPGGAEPKGMSAVRSFAEKRGIKLNGN